MSSNGSRNVRITRRPNMSDRTATFVTAGTMNRRPVLTLRHEPSTLGSAAAAPSPPPPAPSPPSFSAASTAKDRYVAALRLRIELAEQFPITFAAPSAPAPWPAVKIGITRDLRSAMPDMPWSILKAAMCLYTSSAPYLKGLVEGALRLDLDGNDTGVVTADQAEYAAARLAARATP